MGRSRDTRSGGDTGANTQRRSTDADAAGSGGDAPRGEQLQLGDAWEAYRGASTDTDTDTDDERVEEADAVQLQLGEAAQRATGDDEADTPNEVDVDAAALADSDNRPDLDDLSIGFSTPSSTDDTNADADDAERDGSDADPAAGDDADTGPAEPAPRSPTADDADDAAADTVQGRASVHGEQLPSPDAQRSGGVGDTVTPHTDAEAAGERGAWFTSTAPTSDDVVVKHLPEHTDSSIGATSQAMVVVEDADGNAGEMYVTVYGGEGHTGAIVDGVDARGPVGDAFGIPAADVTLGYRTVAGAAVLDEIRAATGGERGGVRTGAPRVKAALSTHDGAAKWVAVEGVDAETWFDASAERRRRVDGQEMADVLAAQLVAGNTDVHGENLLVDEDGGVWVPDLDRCAVNFESDYISASLDEAAWYVEDTESGMAAEEARGVVFERAEAIASRLVQEHGSAEQVARVVQGRFDAAAVSENDRVAFDAEKWAENIADNVRAFAPEYEQHGFRDAHDVRDDESGLTV